MREGPTPWLRRCREEEKSVPQWRRAPAPASQSSVRSASWLVWQEKQQQQSFERTAASAAAPATQIPRWGDSQRRVRIDGLAVQSIASREVCTTRPNLARCRRGGATYDSASQQWHRNMQVSRPRPSARSRHFGRFSRPTLVRPSQTWTKH